MATLCGLELQIEPLVWRLECSQFARVVAGGDEKAHASKMNMGLMSGMFGGNIVEVTVGKIVKDAEAILCGVATD